MANYATLKASIEAVVKTNGNKEITGANLQTVLLAIVNSLGADYQFAGVATPSTSAGTPDQNVFYIGGAGTYGNFGSSFTVPQDSIGLFQYNGSWTKSTVKLLDGMIPTFVMTGAGNDLVTSSKYSVTGGRTYQVTVQHPDISLSGVTYTSSAYVRFSVDLFNAAGESLGYGVYTGMDTSSSPLLASYTFITPAAADYVVIKMRAAQGAAQVVWIADITDIVDADCGMKAEGVPMIDLAVGDENGNDIVQIADGYIKTKNFDSRAAMQPEASRFDLAFGDSSNRDIVVFQNGHIRTKNFSSELIGFKPYQQKTLFHFNVDCSMPCAPYVAGENSFTDVSPLSPVVLGQEYEDRATLYLPASYSPTGNPVRLVIFGRQGGGTFTDSNDYAQQDINTDGTNYLNIVPYLLYLGYAVLALDGTPDGWATEMMSYTTSSTNTFDGHVNGNYISVRSAQVMYDKVIRDYNIRRDGVFGFGYSQGGWMIMNIAELSGIPFIGVALKSPVVNLDGYFDAYADDGVTFKGGKVVSVGGIEYPCWRYFMVRQYYGINPAEQDMSLADFLAIPKQSWRWAGYDPFRRFATSVPASDDVKAIDDSQPLEPQLEQLGMKRMCHFPVKMWIAKNDSNVGYRFQTTMIQGIRDTGCYADIHLYSTGDHSLAPSTWGDNIVGGFTYNGSDYRVFPPTYEVALFYRDNGGNAVTYDEYTAADNN